MGDWSTQPWGTDEAADWFHRFWQRKDLRWVLDELRGFDPLHEQYEGVRATAHVLIAFGSPYCWPADLLDVRIEMLERTLCILQQMIEPPSADWRFLDAWEHDPAIFASVQSQIAALQSLLGHT
jgi:hypothetical protein